MNPLFSTLASLVLACLLMPGTSAADTTTQPDSEGYIRDWLMLAPIPLREGEAGTDALFKEQIRGEAALQPSPGSKVKIGPKELTWRSVTASTNFFDFNAALNSVNDHAVGYIVTYIECETEHPGVIIAVASNDEGRIYFNGVDIYAFSEPRTLLLDSDKGRVTLKKGVNTIIFKIVNEQNSWQGAMRFLNKDGAPLKGLKVKLTP